MTIEINSESSCLDLGLPDTIAARRDEARLIKEATSLLSSRPRVPNIGNANECMKDLIKEQGNSGKNLVRVGTAMIILPDPITGAIGVPLLVAGKVLQSRQSVNLKGVYEELNNSLESLSSMVSSL